MWCQWRTRTAQVHDSLTWERGLRWKSFSNGLIPHITRVCNITGRHLKGMYHKNTYISSAIRSILVGIYENAKNKKCLSNFAWYNHFIIQTTDCHCCQWTGSVVLPKLRFALWTVLYFNRHNTIDGRCSRCLTMLNACITYVNKVSKIWKHHSVGQF